MRAFGAVLYNDLYRLAGHKARFFLYLLMVAGGIAVAVFFNSRSAVIGNIALVPSVRGSVQSPSDPVSSPYLNVIVVQEAPPLSDLVAGRFDAIVTFDGQGGFYVTTIKDDGFRELLEALLRDPAGFTAEQVGAREPGTNIVGFLLMFILMQGVSMAFLISEDIDRGLVRRVAAAPVTFIAYLGAHGFFLFVVLLVPVMLSLAVARLLSGVGLDADLGLSLLEYLHVVALVCALAAAFALFVTTFIQPGDSANMLGSAIAVLTSILAGCFYALERGNAVLAAIIRVLPQKSLLTMAASIEQGGGLSTWLYYELYIDAVIAVLVVAAVMKARRDFVRA